MRLALRNGFSCLTVMTISLIDFSKLIKCTRAPRVSRWLVGWLVSYPNDHHPIIIMTYWLDGVLRKYIRSLRPTSACIYIRRCSLSPRPHPSSRLESTNRVLPRSDAVARYNEVKEHETSPPRPKPQTTHNTAETERYRALLTQRYNGTLLFLSSSFLFLYY